MIDKGKDKGPAKNLNDLGDAMTKCSGCMRISATSEMQITRKSKVLSHRNNLRDHCISGWSFKVHTLFHLIRRFSQPACVTLVLSNVVTSSGGFTPHISDEPGDGEFLGLMKGKRVSCGDTKLMIQKGG